MIETVREWLRSNPVRVRAGIAALVGWLSHQFPRVVDAIGSQTLTGVLTALATLALGEAASRRVSRSKAAAKTYDGSAVPD